MTTTSTKPSGEKKPATATTSSVNVKSRSAGAGAKSTSGNPKAKSKVEALVKTQKKKKGLKDNPLLIIGILSAGLLLVGIIIAVIAMSGGDKVETKAIPEPPTAEDIAQAEAQQQAEREAAMAASQQGNSVAMGQPTDFTVSPTPIETLAQQSAQGALMLTPQYTNGDGMNLVYPDGSILPVAHPFVSVATTATEGRLREFITTNDLIQERTAEDGTRGFYIRMPNGDFAPISDPSASAMMRDSMSSQASSFLSEELNNAPRQPPLQAQQPLQQPQQQVAPPPPVIDAMSQEERMEYRDLIEKTRGINRDLVKENQEIRREMQEQKEDMVRVLQKLEDNKYTSQKLRATSLPLESGWKLHAIVDDRLWLEDPDGQLVSVSEGDVIPSTKMRVITSESSSGLVYITEADK